MSSITHRWLWSRSPFCCDMTYLCGVERDERKTSRCYEVNTQYPLRNSLLCLVLKVFYVSKSQMNRNRLKQIHLLRLWGVNGPQWHAGPRLQPVEWWRDRSHAARPKKRGITRKIRLLTSLNTIKIIYLWVYWPFKSWTQPWLLLMSYWLTHTHSRIHTLEHVLLWPDPLTSGVELVLHRI